MFCFLDQEGKEFQNCPALEDWFELAPTQLFMKRLFLINLFPDAPFDFRRIEPPDIKMKKLFDRG